MALGSLMRGPVLVETTPRPEDTGTSLSADQALVSEIPAGIADLLHERAKQRYLRRLWQTLFCVILVLFIASIAPVPSLSPGERIAGILGVLAFLCYLAYGFTLVWPERWEHQLLQDEIEYRRLHAKWRWER
jgi:lipopolysaccharide export LptBFGC system permease protein LptF